ncbi:hypothetical protein FXF61_11120 [Pseudomonas sp. C27(2019)]|nr:hypothetical protein FXF61_11120 [Pseudomonas sp. C27(2019)]
MSDSKISVWACLASAAFPSKGHPDLIRALRHPWLRLPRHQRGTSEHWCALYILRKAQFCMIA